MKITIDVDEEKEIFEKLKNAYLHDDSISINTGSDVIFFTIEKLRGYSDELGAKAFFYLKKINRHAGGGRMKIKASKTSGTLTILDDDGKDITRSLRCVEIQIDLKCNNKPITATLKCNVSDIDMDLDHENLSYVFKNIK